MNRGATDGRTTEEDLDDLRKKLHLLEADRKAFYHTSVSAKQRNKDQIKQLQKENKELREQFKALAMASGGESSDDKATEKLLAKSEKELAMCRRRLDEEKYATSQMTYDTN
jgi:hypothetical protein